MHSYRPRDPGQGAIRSAGEIPPAAAAGFLRGAAEDPEIPERVRVMLSVVVDALEQTGAMIDEVFATFAETENAERRAEIVRALVRGAGGEAQRCERSGARSAADRSVLVWRCSRSAAANSTRSS